MKKLLSILGGIGLTATSTTSLIACDKPKPNNNSENGSNKPEPWNPQQPPENSNWKLITDKYIPRDTGWYIIIYKWFGEFNIIKVNSLEKYGSNINEIICSSLNDYKNITIYKWKLNTEPTDLQIPTINFNTGKITDWKG